MTWKYDQSSGALSHDGAPICVGYAGHEWGKNNPKAEKVVGIGPIPKGLWRIVAVKDSPNTGPFSIVLEPAKGTETYGRSAFRIHGDSVKLPGSASHGCIIVPRTIREKIWNSNDRNLMVIE